MLRHRRQHLLVHLRRVRLDARRALLRLLHDACMVKRSEIVNLRRLWREGYGLSEKSEALGLFSRVRRAASSLQM